MSLIFADRFVSRMVPFGVLWATLTLTSTHLMRPLSALADSSDSKKQAVKDAKKEAQDQEEGLIGLPDFEFEYDLKTPATTPDGPKRVVVDPDETPEGQRRLREIENDTRRLYIEFRDTEQVRRPLALRRGILIGEMQEAFGRRNEAYRRLNAISGNIGGLERQMGAMSKSTQTYTRLSGQRDNLLYQRNLAQAEFDAAVNAVNWRTGPLEALNAEISPLDAKLKALWNSMNQCRKQWLEIYVPHEKYSRAEFEKLKDVIDKWVRIDGSWPQAYCWAALCAFDLGDYESAEEHVVTAEEVRNNLFGQSKWNQLQALKGLVASKAPGKGQGAKSSKYLQLAVTRLDRDRDWVTLFLCGRALAEKDQFAAKAQAYLEQALEIKPSAVCSKYWLAVMKVNSSREAVKDLRTGTSQLESIWERSGERSWRIAFTLVKTYDKTNRSQEADRLWPKVVELAPRERHDELLAERKAELSKSRQ